MSYFLPLKPEVVYGFLMLPIPWHLPLKALADPDKFLDGGDVSSAGKISFLGSVALGFGAIIDTDDVGFVMTATTVDADATAATTGTITVIVQYVID